MSRSIRHIMIAIAAAAYLMGMLAGCVSDENLIPEVIQESMEPAISFNGSTGTITRAGLTGSAAASALGNNFVVYGFKTTSTYVQTVYDHYNVNYVSGSANSTNSNTAGWEYVGQNANMLNTKLWNNGTPDLQDIKYWDLKANRYDFVAFSLGEQTSADKLTQVAHDATPTSTNHEVAVSKITLSGDPKTPSYTIKGDANDLTKIYISDRVTATKEGVDPNSAYKQAVQFNFRSVAAKVRIGLYETIPGYSVKDVKFYATPAAQESVATPTLYAGSQTIPSGMGTIEVSFPETDSSKSAYNKAKVTYKNDSEKSQTLTLEALTVNAAKELKEEGGNVFLGRASSAASKTGYTTVIPAPAGALTLKMDFKLVSIDYNEIIAVKGAEAVVPAKYTDWKSNYAYTYIFKISDAVGGTTGKPGTSPSGLYPVIFDALEVTNDFGLQQTITTVDQPSITTYAKGALGNDYFVGDHIYISVMNGTPKTLDASNSTLYTVTASPGVEITETNIIENTTGISLTEVASGFMTFVDKIAAIDSPTGDETPAKSGNFAKFTAGNAVYVFKYTESDPVYYQNLTEYNADHVDEEQTQDWWDNTATDEDKIKTPAGDHYKVIRVGDARRPMSLPDIPEEDL